MLYLQLFCLLFSCASELDVLPEVIGLVRMFSQVWNICWERKEVLTGVLCRFRW